MNKMIRTFHPVGQGAFYTEEFFLESKKKFTVVYDCGSLPSKKVVEDEIESAFGNVKGGIKENIDAVFISHFHSDHINGLEKLLTNYNVKRLFLPKLNDCEKIKTILYNHFILNSESDSNDFIEKMLKIDNENGIPDTLKGIFEKNKTEVYLIEKGPDKSESTKNNEKFSEKLFDDINSGFDESSKVEILKIEQYKILKFKKLPSWQYIPFCIHTQSQSDKLCQDLWNIEIRSMDTLLEKLKSDKKMIDEIKKIYESVFSTFEKMNENSMTLYSGPSDCGVEAFYSQHMNGCVQCCNWFNSFHSLCSFNCLLHRVGCLYMGDYNAKRNWDRLYNWYKSYWNKIGTVQIPHHGSSYNYNREINKNLIMFSIISAGHNNKHKHPHVSTMRDILLDGGILRIVSEFKSSTIMQKIHFK